MKIIVASHNPVKQQATVNGFRRMFPGQTLHLYGVTASSEVSDQPNSDLETLQGAYNRAHNALKQHPGSDFWVGIEGGVSLMENPSPDPSGTELAPVKNTLAAFAWVVVLGKDSSNQIRLGKGRTGTFFLPSEVAHLVQQGKELGEADDIVFGRTNSKQDNGAVGLLTGDVIDRAQLYEHAVVLALIPFKNEELYRP